MTSTPLDRVPAPLKSALERRGFLTLTEVQEAVLDAHGETRDLQISSQTGSGKTVALGFVAAPILLCERKVEAASEEARGEASERPRVPRPAGPTLLVIVPTRELAAQVRTELAWLFADAPGVTLDCVTGGTNPSQERSRLQRSPRVLVGTPGRLLDHLTIGALSLASVEQLVLDEADQMLDMGFREELEAILDATPAERRTHLVSATFPQAILRLAERYQKDPLHIEGTQLGVANADIEHLAYRVHMRDRYNALVNLLLIEEGERTLVFVNTRAETAELAERLTRDGFSAQPLSGELVQAQRTRTLAAFKSGAASILVATDVASRGLDLPDVATVVHFAPGIDAEVYTHRSGRTGRAGKQGKSLLFVPANKERRVRWLLSSAGVDVTWRPVPAASKVQKVLEKRARRATWEKLENAPEASEDMLAEAERLLEGRDVRQVVATLLGMGRPEGGPKPRELGKATRDEAPLGSTGGPGGRERREGGFERRETGYAPSNGGSTRFRINWGFAGGANPQRLLAHICRRGGIQGRSVGAIRLQAHDSTFEVESGVVRDFEERVRPRDRRDPHLFIQRALAGKPGPRRNLARA